MLGLSNKNIPIVIESLGTKLKGLNMFLQHQDI